MSRDSRNQPNDDQACATDWRSWVADGSNTMSQRQLTSVEEHGGLDAVKTVAETMGVHLVLLEDDKGDQLVAASAHPFKVIC